MASSILSSARHASVVALGAHASCGHALRLVAHSAYTSRGECRTKGADFTKSAVISLSTLHPIKRSSPAADVAKPGTTPRSGCGGIFARRACLSPPSRRVRRSSACKPHGAVPLMFKCLELAIRGQLLSRAEWRLHSPEFRVARVTPAPRIAPRSAYTAPKRRWQVVSAASRRRFFPPLTERP
jgi:hypothetical protein